MIITKFHVDEEHTRFDKDPTPSRPPRDPTGGPPGRPPSDPQGTPSQKKKLKCKKPKSAFLPYLEKVQKA